jgi:hypothetical protein
MGGTLQAGSVARLLLSCTPAGGSGLLAQLLPAASIGLADALAAAFGRGAATGEF